MEKFRFLLFPLSLIFWIIVSFRNWLFNNNIKKFSEIKKKSICIGNLSIGGTGKTPHVDLLIEYFINQNIKVCTLSRGYGRSTRGIKEVKKSDTAKNVGDEPLMYKNKFGEKINVIVSENRKKGVEYTYEKFDENQIIILDDAFQHRRIKAGLNIIITDYNNRFTKDFILPVGNLRESKKNIKRADIVIISKSPKIEKFEEEKIKKEFNFNPNKIFFSRIKYTELKAFIKTKNKTIKNILLVTGIYNPTPLFNHLKQKYSVTHMKYKDHHTFTKNDLKKIHKKFDTFAIDNKIIVTTEKDYMRIKQFDSLINANWYYQPIKIEINEREKFNVMINNYVNQI